MSHIDDLTLLRYRFETLEGGESDDVARHLRTCSECALRFAQLGQNLDLMQRWEVEQELSDQLTDNVLQQVRQRKERKDAEAARVEAEAALTQAEALVEPGTPADVAGGDDGATPPPPRERVGFWAWLGLAAGGSMRMVRLATTLVVVAGVGYVAGGAIYFGTQKVAIDTRVMGDEHLLPGSPSVLAVEVFNKVTQQPVDQARITVNLLHRGKPARKLFAGQTNKQGKAFASFWLPAEARKGDYGFEVVSRAAGEVDRISHPFRFRRAFKVHLSTDKPLYQPGQTIHVRTLVLERPRLIPAKDRTVIIDVLDPKGVRLARRKVAVSRFGVGAWSLELASDLRLGPYRIKARVDGTVSEMKVKVSRYSLPKFKVEVKPAKAFYLAGETLRAKVSSRYFFGKALSRAKVRAVLFRGNGLVIGDEIKGVTGADGGYELSAELPVDLVRRGRTERILMEVAIKDAAGQEERKQHAVTVARELLQLDAIPEGGKLLANMENTIYVMTTTPDGQAVAAQVEVKLPGGKKLTLPTRKNGLGSFKYTPVGGKGSRRVPVALSLSAEDKEGQRGRRRITLQASLGKLLVATDRAFYKPGETVKVGIQALAEYPAAQVEGIREGQTVLRARVPLKQGKGVAQLDLPEGLTGSLRLDVVAVDAYDIPTPVMSRRVVVAEAKGLSIKISTASAKGNRPGGEAKLRFKVTDAKGKPKAAAIGLSIVDESVFALASSRPALARAYFLLEKHLMQSKYNLSAAESVAGGVWDEPAQEAGRLLLSLKGGSAKVPTRFHKDTFQVKEARLSLARKQFERQAMKVAIALCLVLVLVLVLAAASRLPSWAGGILLALCGCGALLLGFSLLWVAVGLAVAMVLAMAVHHRRTGSMGLAYIALPVVGVGAIMLLWVGQSRDTPFTSPFPTVIKPKPDEVTSTTEEPAGDVVTLKQGLSKALRNFPRHAGEEGSMAPRDEASADKSLPITAAAPKPAPPRAPRRRARPGSGFGGLRGLSGGRGGGARGVKKEAKRASLMTRAKAIPRRQVRVRRHFPETMYVHPELVANEKGEAELTVPLADTITSWRINALASSADGKIGHASEPLKVFQDFFVDLDMPVALVRGDEATIPVAVYNYLSTPQLVRLELKREPWYELTGPATMALRLGPDGVDGADVRIRVIKSGRHRLGLQAHGTKLSDALARQLQVSEAGQERSDVASGTLKPGETVRVTVQVPDAAVKGTSRLHVKLFPSILSSALNGLESTLRVPHGCFEQTSSANYPNALILSYLKRSGKGTAAVKQRAQRYISLGYQKLVGYEVGGGGFSLYGRRPARLQLTAYGLMEFADMARVMSVDEQLIARTQRWLLSKQRSNGSFYHWPRYRRRRVRRWPRGVRVRRPSRPISRRPPWNNRRGRMLSAYVTWSLVESGARDPRVARSLSFLSEQVANTDDPYTMALMAAALIKGKHKAGAVAVSRLAAMAQRQGDLVYFQPRYATVYYGRGAGGRVEATALAAYAMGLAKSSPQLVKGALDYLAKTRDYRGTWYSTQGTVLALRTLLQFAGAGADGKVDVRINGKDAGQVALATGSAKPVLVDLGPKARQGVNVVELASDKTRATFQVVATYTLPWQEKVDDKDKPLALKVAYGRTKVDLGGVIPVDVKLTYRKPEHSGMVMLVLGLPAGCGPIVADLEALKRDGTIGRYEVVTGKLNLYLHPINTGATVQFNLRLKARNKVKTKGAASLAYLYYHPEVRTSVAPTPVAVN